MNLRINNKINTSENIQIGDIVYIKDLIHRLLMKVINIDEKKAVCLWFDQNFKECICDFNFNDLKLQDKKLLKKKIYDYTNHGINLNDFLDNNEFIDCILNNNRLKAIKLVRILTDSGLKEAKEFVCDIPIYIIDDLKNKIAGWKPA